MILHPVALNEFTEIVEIRTTLNTSLRNIIDNGGMIPLDKNITVNPTTTINLHNHTKNMILVLIYEYYSVHTL